MPQEINPGNATTRRYSEQEKAAAVRGRVPRVDLLWHVSIILSKRWSLQESQGGSHIVGGDLRTSPPVGDDGGMNTFKLLEVIQDDPATANVPHSGKVQFGLALQLVQNSRHLLEPLSDSTLDSSRHKSLPQAIVDPGQRIAELRSVRLYSSERLVKSFQIQGGVTAEELAYLTPGLLDLLAAGSCRLHAHQTTTRGEPYV